jgi:hypothetical protein
MAAGQDPLLDPVPKRRFRLPWKAIVIAIVVLIVVGLPVGMLVTHKIDDDPAFALNDAEMPPAASRAIAMAAALVDREVNVNRWVANDPWFLPGHWLDNMPNYQQGMMAAIARFTVEMRDQVGRERGTSQDDLDLREAAGRLQFPGDKWIIDLATSPWPQATSEEHYRTARRHLLAYNTRLADGRAVFERRGDNLLALMDRLALDLGSSSAVLDQRINAESGNPFDTRADDIFYSIKGQAYAYFLILRELQKDYGTLIKDRGVEHIWNNMLASLKHAAEMDPLVVLNGQPDGILFPSHLASQGFYILRARQQMREVSNVLLK